MFRKIKFASLVSALFVSGFAFGQGSDDIVHLGDELHDEVEAIQPEEHRRRYQWVFSYIDRNGECNSCDFGCYAPRCDSNIVHLKKACKVPNTVDDHYVYTCERVGGYDW